MPKDEEDVREPEPVDVDMRGEVDGASYRKMLREMDRARDDRGRLAVVERYARRYQFGRGQRNAILNRFRNRGMRRQATAELDTPATRAAQR